MDTSPAPLLEIRDLGVSFSTDEGAVRAVDGISFNAREGRTLGIVGESGSGKSVATKAVMRLLPANARIDAGSRILLRRAEGEIDVAALPPGSRELRRLRGGDVGMIFQEPMASFSPVYTIGNQMIEAILEHRDHLEKRLGSRFDRRTARAHAIRMLERVGMSNARLRIDQYPHELSGGMRQRAMIAVALSTHPSLLIADEPTTALDVTIQAQILDLMLELQQELGMAMLFITHDMGVIARIAEEVAVMYLGRIVERGPTREVIREPAHPYTRGLLAALPRLDTSRRRLTPVPGDIPSPLQRPAGCPFHTRCPERMPGLCDRLVPDDTALGPERSVACHLLGEGRR